MNGHPREVAVADERIAQDLDLRPKAVPGTPGHIGASMPGKIVEVTCEVGQPVSAGDTLLVSEAMKMETSITATVEGVVHEIFVRPGERIQSGDLLVVLDPA